MNNSPYSTFSPTFGIFSVWDVGHPNRWVVISHCCFNLQFLTNIWCWASIHIFTCHLYILFSEVSVQILCSLLVGLFGFLLLIFKSSLFWIIVLYEMYPLQIFSTSLWLSFRSLEKHVFLKSTFFPLFALWMTKAESSSYHI